MGDEGAAKLAGALAAAMRQRSLEMLSFGNNGIAGKALASLLSNLGAEEFQQLDMLRIYIKNILYQREHELLEERAGKWKPPHTQLDVWSRVRRRSPQPSRSAETLKSQHSKRRHFIL